MENISYSLSPQLRQSLKRIDSLRQYILLAILSPKDEMRLRWQAQVGRIFWALAMYDQPLTVTRNDISTILANSRKRPQGKVQSQALVYKKAFEYISRDWYSSQKPINTRAVLYLHELACEGKLRSGQEVLKQFLAYFQSSDESPVVQAGLLYFKISTTAPFTGDNERLSGLLSYLTLYKEGFDFRGLLILDEYFKKNFADHKKLLRKALETGSQTLWLEYFAKGVETQLEKAMEDITKGRTKSDIPATVLGLNDRQKEIMAILENPSATITNRQVQKMFETSQITASRDLAKLVLLGLLFAHGGGRSVYYTRV